VAKKYDRDVDGKFDVIPESDWVRFFRYVYKKGACWSWRGPIGRNGYGTFSERVKGKHQARLAHRWAYEHMVGPIPAGLHLDHLCRRRDCVNPVHLEPVTARENLLRGNGFAAINARKTHCPHGHEYAPENLLTTKSGGRSCKTCHRDRERVRHAMKKVS
jgi:hypothetical protein